MPSRAVIVYLLRGLAGLLSILLVPVLAVWGVYAIFALDLLVSGMALVTMSLYALRYAFEPGLRDLRELVLDLRWLAGRRLRQPGA